jgi:hypothetical protein
MHIVFFREADGSAAQLLDVGSEIEVLSFAHDWLADAAGGAGECCGASEI